MQHVGAIHTARGQTLVERGRSKRHLQLMIDSIPALAWSALSDGTAEFFDRHYLDYVGLSREKMRNWQWKSVIHPDDMHVVDAAWRDFDRERRDAAAHGRNGGLHERTG
ncbi:hypothetical protein HGP14_26780 [Rhizobium sp. P32RR-XVIII]|uniref:PAS domain-containing protein n=1 Tax=Rhizobium sp. P32RR-XVIII TaxID=2726738 RepID=UPI001456931A|nr:PAS domain-containing protein [Rhizobium sp. P32RR-XVIII]NLS06911.1 hypothetical protein [Rhizobium sp. P32RR-XVIII]